jgi:hypothetical protein
MQVAIKTSNHSYEDKPRVLYAKPCLCSSSGWHHVNEKVSSRVISNVCHDDCTCRQQYQPCIYYNNSVKDKWSRSRNQVNDTFTTSRHPQYIYTQVTYIYGLLTVKPSKRAIHSSQERFTDREINMVFYSNVTVKNAGQLYMLCTFSKFKLDILNNV